ncbi:hypothetical protein R1sor_017312 [Riccia sorocarpa]|uniref:Reverse transcriptase domain-containing protein n=1 Tax=Riccia sorocarpa TaxID=122646 RepID=A0ABD3IA67_9MARC
MLAPLSSSRSSKKRKARTTIKRLLAEGGQLLTQKEDIKLELHRHYSSLYSAVDPHQNNTASTRMLLDNVHMRISAQERGMLDEIPSHKEILDSLRLLPSGKSPGPDGFTKEVFIALWPIVGKSFCEAVVDFWVSGLLLPYFKDGMFFLLPKVDNPLTVAHWRPITLLNTIYNVIAKLLAARMAMVLPRKVPVQQQGFLRGRSTHNCILTFALVHKSLKRERKHAIFFSLDQEKAFDRLQPEFLKETMKVMGFSSMFIDRIAALQEGAETRILFDRTLLPSFQVRKGVRQGCPLSRLLFILATVPFIDTLSKENDAGNIRPVQLSGGCTVSCTCLADDFAVYTQVDESSVSNLFHLLDSLEMAAGCRVNKHKSKILVIGAARSIPDWIQHTGLQIIGRCGNMRYLGASLTTTWRGVDNGRELLARVTRKAESYSHPLLSFEARTIALKHAAFSPLIYHLLSTKFKLGTLKMADSILRDNVWAKDESGRKKKLLASPEVTALGPPNDIRKGCFMLARKFIGVQEATNFADNVRSRSATAGIFSLPQLALETSGGLSPASSFGDSLLPAVLEELHGASILPRPPTFNPGEWVDVHGKTLDLSLRASQIYLRLAGSKELAQAERFNAKWRLTWDVSQWRAVWSVFNLRKLPGRHRYFLWRVLSKAFFDGRKELHLNLPSFACEYCKSGVEDTPHIFLFCPRWRSFWRNLGTKLHGWEEVLTLISNGASIPEVIVWANRGSKANAWFNSWILASIWRLFWGERCILKYQGKYNQPHFLKLLYGVLEEMVAKRHCFKQDILSEKVSQLISLLSVVPQRYMQLIKPGHR